LFNYVKDGIWEGGDKKKSTLELSLRDKMINGMSIKSWRIKC